MNQKHVNRWLPCYIFRCVSKVNLTDFFWRFRSTQAARLLLKSADEFKIYIDSLTNLLVECWLEVRPDNKKQMGTLNKEVIVRLRKWNIRTYGRDIHRRFVLKHVFCTFGRVWNHYPVFYLILDFFGAYFLLTWNFVSLCFQKRLFLPKHQFYCTPLSKLCSCFGITLSYGRKIT